METERITLRYRSLESLKEFKQYSLKEKLDHFSVEDEEKLAFLDGMVDRILARPDTCEGWDFVLKETGKVIGGGGFHNIDERHDRGEIGYEIYEPYWDKGFMSEVLPEIIRYGFEELNFHRIESFVSPSNTASLRLMEKHGFEKEALLKDRYKVGGTYDDAFVFALIK